MPSKSKTKGLCSAQCLVLSIFVLTFYCGIKLLYIANQPVDTDFAGAHDLLSSGYHSYFEKSTDVATLPLRIRSTLTSCQSIYIDSVAEYVKTAGCKMGSDCEQLTCRALLTGNNPSLYNVARKFMSDHLRVVQDDKALIEEMQNCTDFKVLRGYHMNVLPEITDFPIAFTILVHTGSEQTERLLRSIYRPQNIYCIHIDAKASASTHTAMDALSRCFDNVFISSRSERVIYAGISRLQADLNCMKDLVEQRRVQWKYLLNLAALSFPLQTPEDMVQILRIYNGSNDIEGIYGRRILRRRFEQEWLEHADTNSVNQTGKRNSPPPDRIDIVRGSAYGVFSRAFVEFALTDSKARNLFEWSRKTFSPDEHYWATLNHLYSNPHLHTPGGYSGQPNDKPWLATFVKWGVPSGCHGKFVRGICILGVEDLPDLTSRKEFFVNKFYSDFQPMALDCLEAWLLHKTVCPISFDYNYYRSLPFVKA